ncbi:MAG: hypothetical protein V3T83_03685, partial [Acidobacteriota bacterium]
AVYETASSQLQTRRFVMKLFSVTSLGTILLAGSLFPAEQQVAEESPGAKKCTSEPVDITSPEVREKLKTAIDIKPILSSLVVTKPSPRVKVSTMKYEVTFENGLKLIMVGECSGTCSSPHPLGCTTSGCDPEGNRCTPTICSGGEDCSNSCTRVSTF